ncbi:hypothetical protein E2C06_30340 [Dankookia rubra]|uniref:histidine kinase n=1 Tax=Dankookia rubra TaxID=1442381 RepID=A0A4R5Q811_9PROT|nr:HWE histidine kinase domain-containing protein [Dankookia rubra]TDH58876.1 hypothetical protein E2C06_30340 [Dankookia rubra]
MIGTPPPSKRVLCCHDGVWRLVASPRPGEASARSGRELGEYVAALETTHHALRLEAEAAAERAQFQLAEVEHRLKNVFATIQALARQSARDGDTGAAFRAAFGPRLAALARSHDMAGSRYPDGASLAEIVEHCLRPYDDALGRTILAGPAVHLPARAHRPSVSPSTSSPPTRRSTARCRSRRDGWK